MNQEIIDKIKNDLTERRNQILEDLKDIEVGDEVQFPQYGDKPDENAQEVGDYETNLAAEKNLRATLRDIESALERIEKGVYGICKYCKGEIGEKRLSARPVASSCIECKTKIQNG